MMADYMVFGTDVFKPFRLFVHYVLFTRGFAPGFDGTGFQPLKVVLYQA